MRLRPRWCSWVPLSTQQLRLRNLISIEGLNIKCDDASAVICYSLHESTDCDAFYLSEYLPLRQELNWKDIICPRLFKTNEQSVCVKVWARYTQYECVASQVQNSKDYEADSLSPFKNEEPLMDHFGLSGDKMLFTWGVYFSGLVPLRRQGNIKFKDNSLLFFINGDCFTSASHVICHPLTNNRLNGQKVLGFEENKEYVLLVPNYLSESINSDACRKFLKTRYTQLRFNSCDVLTSYKLQQLLKLQGTQRRQLKKTKESKEFAIEIQRRSMYCIAKDQLFSTHTALTSTSVSRHQQRLPMGRALSELFFEEKISPHTLLYAQTLKKQLEILRLRNRLFQSEYCTHTERIAQLRSCLVSLTEIRQQTQTNLQSKQRQLQIEKMWLNSQYKEQNYLIQKKQKIIWSMERRMSTLCLGLRKIYPIQRDSNGLNTINKVPFPGMNVFSDINLGSDTNTANYILPMTLSVSLGYIAHLLQMIALIINRPLRNAIIHQGSRSRIVDIVKEIPHSCSEFPLYSRSTLPSKSVKYAIFLLNQNVAQLCYDIAGIRCDMRLTLENIYYIFIYLADIGNLDEKNRIISDIYLNKRFGLNHCINKNIDMGCANIGNNLLSKSHSSVDMNHMDVPMVSTIPENSFLQLPSSIPMPIEGTCTTNQRVSRSVGSYSDTEDDFKEMHDHRYSKSDSFIANITKTNVKIREKHIHT